jgi:hypothetical protein
MTFDSEKCDKRDRHEVQWPHQTDTEWSGHIRLSWRGVATSDRHEVQWPHQTDMEWSGHIRLTWSGVATSD